MMTNANFDDLADAYDRFRIGYSTELIDLLVNEYGFRPGSAILDVGIGTGLASAPFVARGFEMTGIDPSADMLSAAERHFPNVQLVQGAAEKLPFGDNTFDGAISAQVFHWLDQPAAIRELIRVVKPGKPVAIWWKVLAADDDIRTFRKAACDELGLQPMADSMRAGFRAFYAAPFAGRSLRTVPHVARFTIGEWLGYERSRAGIRDLYGDQTEAYHTALERALLAVFRSPAARLEVRYMQYVYIGIVP
jgi:ubiquinone/menaquinone biosynthesis C-methylase UbiE